MPRLAPRKPQSLRCGGGSGRSNRRGRVTKIVSPEIGEIYRRLYGAFGPQGWWPARTATEVVVGAILTQNTAWRNVERTMERLRAAGALNWGVLRRLDDRPLEELLRPAGTFRVKAKRLRAFVEVLWNDHGGSLRRMLAGEIDEVRRRLLSIPGIGPETADVILLYAGKRPSFVVDAYTKRILRRHFLIDGRARYEEVRTVFLSSLVPDVEMFNEFHALLVELGKRHCRVRAQCQGCPLEALRHDEKR
jgi:endonuclease-3 related protein